MVVMVVVVCTAEAQGSNNYKYLRMTCCGRAWKRGNSITVHTYIHTYVPPVRTELIKAPTVHGQHPSHHTCTLLHCSRKIRKKSLSSDLNSGECFIVSSPSSPCPSYLRFVADILTHNGVVLDSCLSLGYCEINADSYHTS